MENAHDGHRQRIRDKMLTNGPESMKPHEIIEFLLYYSIPRQNTNPLAHALLEHFGTMQRLFDADPREMLAVSGMTPASAEWLHAVGRCIRAYIDADDRDIYLTNRRDVRRHMARFFAESGNSGCWLLCLSAVGRVIRMLPLQAHPVWHAPENMREAIAQALNCRAHSIVLVQRRADYAITPEEEAQTAQLIDSLALIRITLIEHVVIDPTGRYVDYATNPLLRRPADIHLAMSEESDLLVHWLDEP